MFVLPKNSFYVGHQRRIPEYFMDIVLDTIWDHRFMDIESLSPALFHTVDHLHLLKPTTTTTTDQECTLVVANGTTDPDPAISLLTHGNEHLSFLSKFYNFKCQQKYFYDAYSNTLPDKDEQDNEQAFFCFHTEQICS